MSARSLRATARFLSAVSIVSLATTSVYADLTKEKCIEANSSGQDLRRDDKLSAAREQFRACAQSSCPAIVRSDCARRLDELERAQPTIVFDAKDGAGRDLIEVKVSVDGQPLAERLDGKALAIDPGQHVFTFATKDLPQVTQTLVIKEDEKGRRERIVFAAPAAAAPAAAPAPVRAETPATPTADSGSRMPGQKMAGLVIGGVGVLGLASGVVFSLMSSSKATEQQNACPSDTSCPDYATASSAHSTGMTYHTVSTIGFIGGGVLLAGGAALFLTAHPSSTQQTARSIVVLPSVGAGSGGLLFAGAFQ